MNTSWKNVLKEPPADGSRCLVWYHSQQEIFTYNEEYRCWDDSEGDDYYTDLQDAPVYYPLPPNPTPEEVVELTK